MATIEQGFGDEAVLPQRRQPGRPFALLRDQEPPFGRRQQAQRLVPVFVVSAPQPTPCWRKPVEQLINDNTLVALALLVAESQPDHKALMVRLVEHFMLLKADS
jgi:hypothetical protein